MTNVEKMDEKHGEIIRLIGELSDKVHDVRVMTREYDLPAGMMGESFVEVFQWIDQLQDNSMLRTMQYVGRLNR